MMIMKMKPQQRFSLARPASQAVVERMRQTFERCHALADKIEEHRAAAEKLQREIEELRDSFHEFTMAEHPELRDHDLWQIVPNADRTAATYMWALDDSAPSDPPKPPDWVAEVRKQIEGGDNEQ